MDVIEAIKTRRSVRAWSNQNIPDDILQKILEAGRWSPSPLNSQPWHFIVIREKSTIEELCVNAKEGAYLKNSNVCIVFTVEKQNVNNATNEVHAELVAWLNKHDQFTYSASCALENMWLTAWGLGIGGVWVTVDDPSTRLILNIPETQVIIGSLALGYPLGSPIPHREQDRKPLSEMVFFEKFGIKK